MNSNVFVKNYSLTQFDKSEIFRYAGCKEVITDVEKLVEECLEECRDVFTYKVCYCDVSLEVTEDTVDLSFCKAESKALAKNLEECEKAIVFGATVGIEIDRLISKYGRISPAKSVIMQAIGAERIEALCNRFNEDIKVEYPYLKPRFSPGYGDCPLSMQKEIFRILDCPRKIGLSLNDSFLMSPSKSVTAIIGILNKDIQCNLQVRRNVV